MLWMLCCATSFSAPAALALSPYVAAQLRGLDKVTGAASDFTLGVGESTSLGSINITIRACWKAPPEDTPESVAFLEIVSNQQKKIFSGWMFASSPGLNALEHPVYDVWVISCTALAPESWDGKWEEENTAEQDKALDNRF